MYICFHVFYKPIYMSKLFDVQNLLYLRMYVCAYISHEESVYTLPEGGCSIIGRALVHRNDVTRAYT